MTIGSVETLDADEARRRAKSALSKAHLGTDPQLEKAEARAQAAVTLGRVVEDYLARYAAKRLKPRTLNDVERYLRQHWGTLSALPIHKVTRADVAARLARSRRTTAGLLPTGRVRRWAVFTHWAIAEGLTDANPRRRHPKGRG